jgi:hypothetical protein
MTALTLAPESVVEDSAIWTFAVKPNQNLLGSTMLVLERPYVDVVKLEPDEWKPLHLVLRRAWSLLSCTTSSTSAAVRS